jgi:hypothetical protein
VMWKSAGVPTPASSSCAGGAEATGAMPGADDAPMHDAAHQSAATMATAFIHRPIRMLNAKPAANRFIQSGSCSRFRVKP